LQTTSVENFKQIQRPTHELSYTLCTEKAGWHSTMPLNKCTLRGLSIVANKTGSCEYYCDKCCFPWRRKKRVASTTCRLDD